MVGVVADGSAGGGDDSGDVTPVSIRSTYPHRCRWSASTAVLAADGAGASVADRGTDGIDPDCPDKTATWFSMRGVE
ncbi:hypothetical protein [Haloglomus irregulare]|uniref:hypothetical protein n=1 Tax=Haloglomus irregulare TaxID=2234134 RepID=UPI0011851107|nr:hypothetical protein [Haloglomus irregulare]